MDQEPGGIEIVIAAEPVTRPHLTELSERPSGQLVKAVVDIAAEVMAIGGVMHADEEALLLLDRGSRQPTSGASTCIRTNPIPSTSWNSIR